LNREDFDDMHQIAKLAATAGISLDEFKRTFKYLIEKEPPPILPPALLARAEGAPATKKTATKQIANRAFNQREMCLLNIAISKMLDYSLTHNWSIADIY